MDAANRIRNAWAVAQPVVRNYPILFEAGRRIIGNDLFPPAVAVISNIWAGNKYSKDYVSLFGQDSVYDSSNTFWNSNNKRPLDTGKQSDNKRPATITNSVQPVSASTSTVADNMPVRRSYKKRRLVRSRKGRYYYNKTVRPGYSALTSYRRSYNRPEKRLSLVGYYPSLLLRCF